MSCIFPQTLQNLPKYTYKQTHSEYYLLLYCSGSTITATLCCTCLFVFFLFTRFTTNTQGPMSLAAAVQYIGSSHTWRQGNDVGRGTKLSQMLHISIRAWSSICFMLRLSSCVRESLSVNIALSLLSLSDNNTG